MNDLWEVQKSYIKAVASCEAYRVAAIVTAMVTVMSFFYGVNICMTASKIQSLEQRIEAIEKEGK